MGSNLFTWFAERQEILAELEPMLWELEGSCFEVVLIPAQEQKHSGHCVRALQSANPVWYSRFAGSYTNCRGIGRKQMKRARTFIKREHTINALNRMIAGDFSGVYAERILAYVKLEVANRKRAEAYKAEEYEPFYLEIGGKLELCPF